MNPLQAESTGVQTNLGNEFLPSVNRVSILQTLLRLGVVCGFLAGLLGGFFAGLTPSILLAQAVHPGDGIPKASLTGEPYNFMVDSRQTRDGLPANIVRAIAETPDGYLWIATTEGLVRYDGAQFRIYTRENVPALADNSIYCLLTSRDGSLWIGTEGSGLVQFQGGTFRHYSVSGPPATGFVRNLYQDSNGVMWVATDDGLFRVQGDHLARGNVELGMPAFNVSAIIQDHLGRRWVGGLRLFASDHGSAREYVLPRSDVGSQIKSLLETRDGSIWAGTIDGLYRLSPGTKEFARVPGITGTVRSLLEAEPGELWAGSTTNGIYRIRGQGVARLVAPDSSLSNAVFAFFRDSERNLWIGTQSGITRLARAPMRILEPPDGRDLAIGTVSLDDDGTLWYAADQLIHFHGNGPNPWHSAGIKGARIRNFLRSRDRSFWIGTNGDGLYHVTPAATLHYDTGKGLVNNNVRSLTEAKDGSLWIGTDDGVSHLDRHGLHNLTEANGLAYNSVRSIVEDRDGDIWIGTDHGLDHLRDGSFVDDAATWTLSSGKVWSIFQDSDGKMWFGTHGDGLYSYSQGNIAHFGISTGLVSGTIFSIMEDARKRLWLSSPSAVMLLDLKELSDHSRDSTRPSSMRIFSANTGGRPSQFFGGTQPAAVLTRDGDAGFPSSRGLWMIHPDLDVEPHRAQVNVESLTVDGRNVPVANSVDLPAGGGRIEIVYEFVLLGPQDEWRFHYKLDGFDRDWTLAPPGQRMVAYTNIPPGHYRFEVETWNANHPELKASAFLNLSKKSFFYQTMWFRILVALAVIALAFLAYYIRVRQLNSRFQAVAAERARIAREMHDTLLQGCASAAALLNAAMGDDIGDGDSRLHLMQYATTQIRATMDEARQAISSLRTDAQTPRDLVQSLSIMTERNGRAYGVETALVVHGEPFDMDQPTTRALAMIVREAVFNAILHANTQSVRAELAFSPEELTIEVCDDGEGFAITPSHSEDHYGIMGMRERVDSCGGTFDIESALGKGTSVRIRIPRERVQTTSR